MDLRNVSRKVAPLLVTCGLALSIPSGGAGGASKAPAKATLKPPVIHEVFTLLPCDPNTTVGTEGCEEHQVVKFDGVVDRAEAVIFSLLHDASARKRLITAQEDWVRFRLAECRSESDAYEGGSEAPVVAGQCMETIASSRLADLKAFYTSLTSGRTNPPAFPAPPS
jgi:uncharacterized protein YecT (DUF1311 family)